MNVKLEAALAYSRMRWRIFPCHSIVEGRCSCSKNPSVVCEAKPPAPGKHPRIKGGFKAATDDEAQIRRWWTKWPDANIALATGGGIAVFDIDGEEGFAEFGAFVQAHGRVPETLTSQTGRGAHLLFATRDGAPSVRNAARGKVHVRGDGGYIILPPSNHISGRNYKWIKKVPLATLPDSLRQWSQGYEVSSNTGVGRDDFRHLGGLPGHLAKAQMEQRDITQTAIEALKTVWSPSEQARLTSALKAIDVKLCKYDDFFQVGMALKDLDWEKSDGTDIGFELWDAWCSQSEHYNQAGLETKWRSFGRRSGITLGTVYHLAQQHGWNGGLPPLGAPPASDKPAGMNGHANGAHALPAAFLQPGAIIWPDRDEEGRPKSTCTNAGVAVRALGISCRKDLFHDRFLVAGEPIHAWAGDMSDDVIQMIRKTIRYKFGFDPKVENTRDACTQLCLEHQFDPVADYLDGLRWDGTPRLEGWLTRYMGAGNTELNRAIGRLSLVAAVRRVRHPGTKFDQIIVLEGPEGKGKSLAIEVLAGRENFSDGKILGLSDREQQEQVAGVWLYEIAELTGLRKTEVEHVKAFASRTVDRARPAYGRFRVDRPRRTIFFATTNRDDYLQSDTGNRRFWPVATFHIDVEGLRRDRDQLWAEAALCEARGDSIGLPEKLWQEAGAVQAARLESDEWEPMIRRYIDLKQELHDFSIMDVLADNQYLQLRPGDVGRGEQMRAGAVLRRMGMDKFRKRVAGGALEWRYRRPAGI